MAARAMTPLPLIPSGWFLRPDWLWLLTALPLLGVLLVWAWRQRCRALHLLGARAAALAARPSWRRAICGLLLTLALVLLAIGAAGPQWGRDWKVEVMSGRDIIVVLDLSRSMLAEQPSRLERARRGLEDLARTIEQRGGYRLGLVVFAARPAVICHLTHDASLFRHYVREQDAARVPRVLRPAGDTAPSGTRIGAGLQKAVEWHERGFLGGQEIILVSDGDDPAGDNEWIDGAEAARQRGIPVHVVGVGDPITPWRILGPEGPQLFDGNPVWTRLREEPLREIARRTQGVYIPAHTRVLPLGRLFQEVIEPRPRLPRPGDELPPVYVQRYPWFLAPALGLLALALLVSGARRRVK